MKKLFAIAATVAFIISVPEVVRADWQFTKWGMSPVELEKISPVKLESANNCPVNNSNKGANSPFDARFSSKWTVGSINFTACYLFLDNKLHIVNLFTREANAEAIIKGLSQKHGFLPKVNNTLKSLGIVRYVWDMSNEKVEFSIRSGMNYPYLVRYESKSGSDESAARNNL